MTLRRISLGFVLAGLLSASLSAAEAPTRSRTGVAPTAAPIRTDPEVRQALRLAVANHLARAGLAGSLGGFVLTPTLLELRRYVDPGQKQAKLVCVVAISIQSSEREIVAEVRGSAATLGAAQLEALDAAAHSAVLRVADTLAALRSRAESKRVARR